MDNLTRIRLWLIDQAAALKIINLDFARGLLWLSDQMTAWAHEPFPEWVICSDCGGRMTKEEICKDSLEYRSGDRYLWTCPTCGEMEIR